MNSTVLYVQTHLTDLIIAIGLAALFAIPAAGVWSKISDLWASRSRKSLERQADRLFKQVALTDDLTKNSNLRYNFALFYIGRAMWHGFVAVLSFTLSISIWIVANIQHNPPQVDYGAAVILVGSLIIYSRSVWKLQTAVESVTICVQLHAALPKVWVRIRTLQRRIQRRYRGSPPSDASHSTPQP